MICPSAIWAGHGRPLHRDLVGASDASPDRANISHSTSRCGAGTPAQCHILFPKQNTCINCGVDALVRSRPPGRLFARDSHLILRLKSGSRGTRADRGVCPTNSAAFRYWEKYVALGRVPAPHRQAECEEFGVARRGREYPRVLIAAWGATRRRGPAKRNRPSPKTAWLRG